MAIGIRAYARHRASRGLPGTVQSAVQYAIDSGRLVKSLSPDRKKIIDVELADREWEANSRSDHAPLTGPTAPAVNGNGQSYINPLGEARARREAAQASLREMELAERRGELIATADIEARLANTFMQCRTRLLSIPSRARQRDPSLSSGQLTMLESLIREALEDLADLPADEQAG